MDALEKALSRCKQISDDSFHRGMAVKAEGGGLDLGPSSGQGFGFGQEQSRYREGYSLNKGWTYSATHALSSLGAGQPVVVARLKDVKREGSFTKKDFHRMSMSEGARLKTADKEFEILESHLAKKLLENPNSFQGRWQFVYSALANLLLTGWSYFVADVNKGEVEIYSLPTTWIRAIHDAGPFTKIAVINPKKPSAEPAILNRDQFAFIHLPDPSDPLSAKAPVGSQLSAVRIDDHIQTSQEAFFGNGIFPSTIITVGKQPFSDTEGRPVLSNAQRRQIFGAVRRAHAGVQNYGKPAIIDGMIEKIERLSATQNEMGWQRSEDKIRSRILSPLGVAPYVMGEAVPGSYAQSYNTKEIFYDRVNTHLDLLGNALTNLLAGIFDDPALLVWWEQKKPIDPSLQQALWISMRGNNDISQNEMRAKAGLPPDEDLNQGIVQPSMAANVTQVLTLLGGGQIQIPQAQALLEGMGLPTKLAKRIAGVGLKPPEPPPQQVPPKPPEGDVEKPEEDAEKEPEEEAIEELKKSVKVLESSMDVEKRVAAILEDVECCGEVD